MSKDKYPCIFSAPNGGYCVYYPQIFFGTRAVNSHSDVPRFKPGNIQSRATFIDQSRANDDKRQC